MGALVVELIRENSRVEQRSMSAHAQMLDDQLRELPSWEES